MLFLLAKARATSRELNCHDVGVIARSPTRKVISAFHKETPASRRWDASAQYGQRSCSRLPRRSENRDLFEGPEQSFSGTFNRTGLRPGRCVILETAFILARDDD